MTAKMNKSPSENNTNDESVKFSQSQINIIHAVLGEDSKISRDDIIINDDKIPVTGGVIRFRTDSGYAVSFAKQWTKFQINQYDRNNGTNLYRDRFLRETGWPAKGLDGELILEAGCGAGAFTCQLLETGARILSFDYGGAVDVAKTHNNSSNVVFLQADILDMPFLQNRFDRVFCHGVIQHTPDPQGAFAALARMVKPGGRISIDVYLKDRRIETWKAKYLWRWLTKRIDPDKLMAFLEISIPLWLPFDTMIKRTPVFGRFLGSIIPCMNYFWTDLSREERIQWAIMNTFDALSPKYDKPASLREVDSWFENAGFEKYEVRRGGNGVVGNGIKK
ncbi:MAG: class I SAM-dependent methyltransferase [Rhodospirillaceae bacterium]|jgi:SAM-dependent methyltransferase|nr:class I SAM-dependent methyltransferase [Rhodospirillaceae bacterium]